MKAAAVIASLLAAAAAASAATCSSSLDCGLNGACKAAGCECVPSWKGERCGEMNLLPAASANKGGAYGYSPNVTSWGGGPPLPTPSGEYYLVVTEMVKGCGLKQWQTNSQIALAKSRNVEGPYEKVATLLLPEAHNTQLVTVPEKYASTANNSIYALFHIGPGDNSSRRAPCEGLNGTRLPHTAPHGSPANLDNYVHVANNISGPWTAVPLGLGCNNPAPMLHPNGTWFLICNGGGFVLHRASSVGGPWTTVTKLPPNPPHTGTWEDPFLYLDAAGHWHVLAHSWDHANDAAISGHYYSADGDSWHTTGEQPYGNTAQLDDGSVLHMRTRERPKVFFAADGVTPLHLFNGINTNKYCPSPASACKTTTGYDWDYTFVQPIAH